MKHFIPLLILIALVFNLLVPIHSDWFFSVLTFECSLKDFIFKIFLDQKSLGKCGESLFDLVINNVFYNFGENGVATVQLIIFLLLALIIYNFFSYHTHSIALKSYPLSFLVCICLIGVIQFGQDMYPGHFFPISVFIFMAFLKRDIKSKFDVLVSSLTLFILTLVDIRILFAPIVALMIVGFSKIRISYAFLSYLIVVAISFVYRSYLYFIYSKLQLKEHFIFSFGALNNGITFDYAFLILLALIFYFKNINEKVYAYEHLLIILFLLLSPYSYLLKISLGIFFSYRICMTTNSSHFNKRFIMLQEALYGLQERCSSLSYQGRVFFLVASIFVGFVSYYKKPITEELFPVTKINLLIEDKICPSSFDPRIQGYLRFRFNHLKECMDTIENVNSRHDQLGNFTLKGNYSLAFPDTWR